MLIYIQAYNHNFVYMPMYVSVSYTHTYTEYMIEYVYVRYDVYTLSYRSFTFLYVDMLTV